MDMLRNNVIDYLRGDVSSTPWNDAPVSTEYTFALNMLAIINSLGFITIKGQGGLKSDTIIERGYLVTLVDKNTPNLEAFFSTIENDKSIFVSIVDLNERTTRFLNPPTSETPHYNSILNILHLGWTQKGDRVERYEHDMLLSHMLGSGYTYISALSPELMKYAREHCYVVTFVNLEYGLGLEDKIMHAFNV